MAAEESERSPLPFEPNKKRQKPAKAIKQPVLKTPETENKPQQQRRYSKQEMAIPEVVSQRMIRRVAAFCGVPTFLGVSSLIVSYLLVTLADIQLP
ncbi:MAG: photosystem II biosynthesis protein, partial [Aphanizomenon sp.]